MGQLGFGPCSNEYLVPYAKRNSFLKTDPRKSNCHVIKILTLEVENQAQVSAAN